MESVLISLKNTSEEKKLVAFFKKAEKSPTKKLIQLQKIKLLLRHLTKENLKEKLRQNNKLYSTPG